MGETAAECAPQVKSGKKKRLWSMDLQKAAADSKRAHFRWKQAGKPGPEHPLSVQRTKGKRPLWTQQCQQQADYRSSVYNDIMDADATNKRLFYCLVNRQRRGGRTSLGKLIVDDVHLTSDEAIREGWASYFQKLATPKERERYNDQ